MSVELVTVVEVFNRMDGIYVFADHADALRFEAAVNGTDDPDSLRFGSACSVKELAICDTETAEELIKAEQEDE